MGLPRPNPSPLGRWRQDVLATSRAPEGILAAFAVGLVTLLLVPLPTPLLDVLLATNITGSVLVLLLVVLGHPQRPIHVFPTVLLLSTLLRVALTIACSRQILLNGQGGAMIGAFGRMVIQGNALVGAILFSILTLVQFLVVAKGSERIAEVGARFMLDALPGKQMAIDADVRMGSISPQEAQTRRAHLLQENHFFGAMDGAMKFVKGDVVATFLIALINLVGGVAVGVGQRSLDWTVALKRYGTLAVGDGLAAQIPSLLLSTAAGILVTRGQGGGLAAPLHTELSVHLLGNRKALHLSAFFGLAMAFLPGFPPVPFLAISAVLLGVSAFDANQDRREGSTSLAFVPLVPGALPTRPNPVGPPVPWSLALSADLAPWALQGATSAAPSPLRSWAAEWIATITHQLGVPLPEPAILVDPSLPPRHLRADVREVPAFTLPLGPANDVEAANTLRAPVEALLRQRCADFLGLSETQALVDLWETQCPGSTRALVPKLVSLQLLNEVLRRLLQEQVRIRDLDLILRVLAKHTTDEKDPDALTELVRSELRHAITHDVAGGTSPLEVVRLDGFLEETLRRALSPGASGTSLPMPPSASQDVRLALTRALSSVPSGPRGPILLVPADLRRTVRALVQGPWPDVRVLCPREILPETQVRCVATATLRNLPDPEASEA